MCWLAGGGNGFWGMPACWFMTGAVHAALVCWMRREQPSGGAETGGGGGEKAEVRTPLAAMAPVLCRQ